MQARSALAIALQTVLEVPEQFVPIGMLVAKESAKAMVLCEKAEVELHTAKRRGP